MKNNQKKYFTLPEVTMAIAILGIGLISILGVFPVAIKSGLQAVKVSESIHKARAVANLYQTFALRAPDTETSYTIPIDDKVLTFAFKDPDNLVGGAGTTFVIPPIAKTREGDDILDALGNKINGITRVNDSFLNGKFQLDRVFLNVNNEFDSFFYIIRRKFK